MGGLTTDQKPRDKGFRAAFSRKIQPARLFIVGLAIGAQTSVADLFEVGGWHDGMGAGNGDRIQVKFLIEIVRR